MAVTTVSKPTPAGQGLRHLMVTLCFILVLGVYLVIWLSVAPGHDWRTSFAPAGRTWWSPYQYPFHNPPWVAPLLWPMAILPDRVGFVVNGLICSAITVWLVIRQGGSWLAVLVVLLSPSSIGTQLVGNIEWVPMLGILIGGAWGTPFLLAKPQTVGLVALLFFARTGFRWRFWLPAAGVLAASLLVWGWWPAQIPTLPRTTPKWNLAIFPWGVPLAIACAWLAWKRNALRWALLAGVLLTPYLGIGSLTPVIAVWSARYPRAVGLLLVTFWLPMGIVLWSRL